MNTRNNDMAAGSFDPEAKYAQLGERVENQGTRIGQLETLVTRGFSEMGSQIRALSDEFRGGTKTQWPIIIGFSSVTITILGGLGFLALQPLKDNAYRLEMALVRLSETSVSQKEIETRAARGLEDRTRTEASIKDIREAQVPRQELDRVWQGYDQRFGDHQRQIDELKQAQGSVYGQRDIILDLKENQQRLEREIARLSSQQTNPLDR